LLLPVQALFRKIAAALPGMESMNQNKQEQAEEAKLATSTIQLEASKPAPAASTCAC
jgi:Ras-related protein Rab-6A